MFELRPYHKNNKPSFYDPFRAMDEFEKNFFSEPFEGFPGHRMPEFKTDIKRTENGYLLEADLPGFEKKDIQLDLDKDTLTIKAERHSDHEDSDKKKNYVRCERSYGCYIRQFDVSGIDTENIKAKYDNGVLTLELPSKALPENTKKRLEIE